jgi:hypothetical protein
VRLTLVPQLTGSATQSDDCGPSAGAVVVAFATNGNDLPTAVDVRRFVRTPGGNPDNGPTSPHQIADAIRAGWGISTDLQSPGWFDALWDRLRDRRECAHVAIWYGALVGTKHYASRNGFVSNHSVVLADASEDDCEVADSLADGRSGVPKGPQRWPRALVRRACGAVQVRGGSRLGQGYVVAGISRAAAIAPQPSEGEPMIDLVPMTLKRRIPIPAGTVLRKSPDGAKFSTVENDIDLGMIGAPSAEWYCVASGDRGVYVKRAEVGKPFVGSVNVGR